MMGWWISKSFQWTEEMINKTNQRWIVGQGRRVNKRQCGYFKRRLTYRKGPEYKRVFLSILPFTVKEFLPKINSYCNHNLALRMVFDHDDDHCVLLYKSRWIMDCDRRGGEGTELVFTGLLVITVSGLVGNSRGRRRSVGDVLRLPANLLSPRRDTVLSLNWLRASSGLRAGYMWLNQITNQQDKTKSKPMSVWYCT